MLVRIPIIVGCSLSEMIDSTDNEIQLEKDVGSVRPEVKLAPASGLRKRYGNGCGCSRSRRPSDVDVEHRSKRKRTYSSEPQMAEPDRGAAVDRRLDMALVHSLLDPIRATTCYT